MHSSSIKFGTDGWRDIIAESFTFDNVALVGQALSAYLEEDGQRGKPIIIGFDRRFLAENYAAHLANLFKGENWDVIVSDAALPTPVVAFGVKNMEAAGAIMLTASHNPYYYQGLKFIPHFAGPAMPAATDRITQLISEISTSYSPPGLRIEWDGETACFRGAYFEHLDSIVNQHSLSSSNLRVLYNPMHGVGAGFLDAYLESRGIEVVSLNSARDVHFGSTLPDPSPDNLKAYVPAMVEQDCGILFATDGDADRFGIVDADGRYFGANQCLPLLADFLINYKRMTGSLVRTVATSHMLDGIAARHGEQLIETAVGFKYVGQKLREGALIGGEESGGISIKGHMPEKDGILALILILELISTAGDSLQTLYSSLMGEIGQREYLRIDQHLGDADKARLLNTLASFNDKTMAGKEIVGRNDLDGHKFLLADGSWAMFRASGTEPVVRIYLEVTESYKMARFKGKILEFTQALLKD